MRVRLRAVEAALVLGLALVAAVPAAHAASDPDAWSYDLARELMSPYCPGRTLVDCPSSQAADLRMWIQDQARNGRSEAEIREDLYARFGDVIRQAPSVRGFGAAAYVIPVLAFLAGGAIVVLFLRRQAEGRAPAAAEPLAHLRDAELEREVDEELGRG